MTEKYDLAIVGGGIAGLYCALNTPPGTSVALFEGSDRFGGKLETVDMAGFQAEYGSMRFDPGRQRLIGKLIEGLGLETEPFPEYTSPPAAERRTVYALERDEQDLNALQLFALGIRRILGKSEKEMETISEEELEDIRRKGKHRGAPIWEQGIWNMLSDVLSYDAVKYIMADGSFFHGIHENPGAAGTMITWVKMLQMSPDLKGIKGGMQLITDRMLEQTKKRGTSVFAGHRLQSMSTLEEDSIELAFDRGRSISRRVILAVPPCAIRQVDGIPADIISLLDSVIQYPLLKCFFVVRNAWWEGEIPNRGVEAFPARELHYCRQGTMGNIMVYADRPYANYWGRYVKTATHDRAEIGSNSELPERFAERMKIGRDQVVAWGIRDWRSPPYGAGVHLWKAGVEPWKVSERLEAFVLPGGSRHSVHVCGEAFSHYQGFMEGALRSARSVLTKALC